MSPIGPWLDMHAQAIASVSARLGRPVDVAALGITSRAGEVPLGPPGARVSPNGACRLFPAADGWMAVNLAREEDRELVAAWLECDPAADPWDLVDTHAAARRADDLRERAGLLGLPACRVGEVASDELETLTIRRPDWARAPARATPRVVDLSALWAGPLCGAILAAMGAEVTRVESVRRPDPTRQSMPGLFRRLNGAKAELVLDLAAPDGHARLRDLVLDADIVITGARRRGLAGVGLDPEALLAARPGLIWVAVTGYGLSDDRVAFGDDAAAAGGLVGWTSAGEPRFLGDALADPVTGVAAAAGALRALETGGGVLADCAMARMSAGAAATCGVQVFS